MPAGAEADPLRGVRDVRRARVIFPPEIGDVYEEILGRGLGGERMDRHHGNAA